MSDHNEKNIVEQGIDKVKDLASTVKNTVQEGYNELVGHSQDCGDKCLNESSSIITEDKEQGGVIMDKGYWDDKGMYYQGPSEDQVLYPG